MLWWTCRSAPSAAVRAVEAHASEGGVATTSPQSSAPARGCRGMRQDASDVGLQAGGRQPGAYMCQPSCPPACWTSLLPLSRDPVQTLRAELRGCAPLARGRSLLHARGAALRQGSGPRPCSAAFNPRLSSRKHKADASIHAAT